MIPRTAARVFRRGAGSSRSLFSPASCRAITFPTRATATGKTAHTASQCMLLRSSAFHTYTARLAQSPTADAVMEDLTELYATAKDEFEIAAEETEKKTVYAADDREAAQDALKQLQEGYQKAIKESSPDVAKEVQSRVGPRIRELENAVKAMEEMAMED